MRVIFSKNWFFTVGSSKYKNDNIKAIYFKIMKETFKIDKKEAQELTFSYKKMLPCAVTSFNIENNQICWFSKEKSPNIKLIDALVSTCAAPTYFPIHCFEGEYEGKIKNFSCIDGGIWGNDPRLYAFFYRRVIINSFIKHNTYNIISFGTGQVKGPNKNEKNKAVKSDNKWDSTSAWLIGSPNVIDIILEASTAMVDNIFETIEDTGLVNSTKVQVTLTEVVRLDDVKATTKLKKMVEEFCKENPDVVQAAVDHTMFMGGTTQK